MKDSNAEPILRTGAAGPVLNLHVILYVEIVSENLCIRFNARAIEDDNITYVVLCKDTVVSCVEKILWEFLGAGSKGTTT